VASVGCALSQRAVIFLIPVLAVFAALAVLSIPSSAIDHERARALDGNDIEHAQNPSGARVLWQCRPFVIFDCCTMLIHFANAPLLPLGGLKLALQYPALATAMMSACIIAAQIIMLPTAVLVGHGAVIG